MFNLRKQIAALKEENAGQERTIDLLREERDEINKRREALLDRVRQQDQEVIHLREKVAEQKTAIAEQNKIIRKQSEADLLLNALQAVGIVPKPGPKVDYFARAGSLQQQRAQASHAQTFTRGPSALGGLFGPNF